MYVLWEILSSVLYYLLKWLQWPYMWSAKTQKSGLCHGRTSLPSSNYIFFVVVLREKRFNFIPASEVMNYSSISNFMCWISERYYLFFPHSLYVWNLHLEWSLIFSGTSGKSVLKYSWAEIYLKSLLWRKTNLFTTKNSILEHFCDLRGPCSPGSFKTLVLFEPSLTTQEPIFWLTEFSKDDWMVRMKNRVGNKVSIELAMWCFQVEQLLALCDLLQIDLSAVIWLLCSC